MFLYHTRTSAHNNGGITNLSVKTSLQTTLGNQQDTSEADDENNEAAVCV